MILLLFPDNIALNESVLLLGAFAFILVVIGLPMVLKKKEIISGHTARKMVHLFAGFSCFIVPFLNYPWLALILSGLFLAVTRISTPKTQVFQMMGEKDEKVTGYLAGPFSYALSINILVLVFSFMPNYFFFPAASIMVMMISDGAMASTSTRSGTPRRPVVSRVPLPCSSPPSGSGSSHLPSLGTGSRITTTP
jgi:hypothetical protein